MTVERKSETWRREIEAEVAALRKRQAALVEELEAVNDDLRRGEAVLATLDGRRPRPRGRRAKYGHDRELPMREVAKRAQTVQAWARGRSEPFTGRQVAEALAFDARGIGPFLTGMVGRGELEDAGPVHDPDHSRDVNTYRLPSGR